MSPHHSPSIRSLLSGAAVLAVLATLVTAGASVASAQAPEQGVVNINTADAQTLAFLPGIGKTRAQQIIAYRSRRPFKRTVELARVKGIGLKMVRRLKPMLRVAGPSTLRKPSKSGG